MRTEDIRDVRAADLRVGMTVDLGPTAEEFDPGDEGARLMAQCEFATVIDPTAWTEPVEDMSAVLIYTDQGNYKVPADWIIQHAAHLDEEEESE